MTDADLLSYLDEALPASEMANLEQTLRSDAACRTRLALLIAERDAGWHSVSSIWRRQRMSCPSRSQLGSYLLDVLPADEVQFVRLHLDATGCRFCQANLDDLRHQQAELPTTTESRRRKYFQSSVGHLHSR